MQQVLVLLVEDNHINAEMAEAVLEDAGYQVLVAENAEEALSLAQTHRPGLVLMDIHLPGIDGLTALQQLRSDPQTRAAKVIAVTAMAMKGDREQFLAAGFDGYVSKPFRVVALLDAIRAALSA
jgi:two-component system cell cycle response regulator DivK